MLQKGEEKYHNCGGKEKAAEYYQANKDVLSEKEAKRQYNRDRYKKIKEKLGGKL